MELRPDFDDCPAICSIAGNGERRSAYCDGCEVKPLEDDFRERASAELAKYGDARWKFEDLWNDFYAALSLEQTDPRRWSYTAGRFIGIIRSERNRLERIDAWNLKQKQTPST